MGVNKCWLYNQLVLVLRNIAIILLETSCICQEHAQTINARRRCKKTIVV